jgi:hypothetical protein
VTVAGQRKTALCKTKQEALGRKRELLELLLHKEASPLPLFSLQDARRLSMDVRWRGCSSERTAGLYSQAAVDYFGANTLLTDISTPQIDAWRRQLLAAGNRPATVNKKVSALRAMFSDAQLRGHITTTPQFPKQLKLKNTKDRVISDEERDGMCHYLVSIGHAAAADCLVFLLESCARWGEVERLRVERLRAARDTSRSSRRTPASKRSSSLHSSTAGSKSRRIRPRISLPIHSGR